MRDFDFHGSHVRIPQTPLPTAYFMPERAGGIEGDNYYLV